MVTKPFQVVQTIKYDNDNECALSPYIHRKYKPYRSALTKEDGNLENNELKNISDKRE